MLIFFKYFIAVLYRIFYLLSQKLFFKKGKPLFKSKVIVVGSYLAGGAGKTPFSIELASRLISKGLRVAVLCHKKAWDEFILFKEYNIPVFSTENRYKTAHEIDGLYNFIICDGGLEDTRFVDAITLSLCLDERACGIMDLIPCGKCISLRKDHKNAYNITCKDKNGNVDVNFSILHIFNALNEEPKKKEGILMTSIGDPLRFKADAEHSGWSFCDTVFLKDHSPEFFSEVQKNIGWLLPILMTEKDYVKLDSSLKKNPQIFVAKELVTFSPSFETFLKKMGIPV